MKVRNRDEGSASAGAGEFRLEEFVPFRLAVIAGRVSRLFAKRFEKEFGLSIPEWRVLTVIGRFETGSPSMVSAWTSMDKVKVSRAAATLVARGLLRQGLDPLDGRGRILRLTRKGIGVHASIVPLARQLEDELSAGLSKAEWASLQKAMDRLEAHLDNTQGHDLEAAAE